MGFDQPKCKHEEVALVPGPGTERRSRVCHVGLSAFWQCIKLGKTAELNTGASQEREREREREREIER